MIYGRTTHILAVKRVSIQRRFQRTALINVGGLITNIASISILPAIFIRQYGVSTYGEWLAIMSAVSWMSTLDVGVHSYSANRLAIEFHNDQLRTFQTIQSVALRLTLGILCFGLVAVLAILYFVRFHLSPTASFSSVEFSSILLLTAIYLLVGVAGNQLQSTLKAIGYPERAAMWNQSLFFFANALMLLLVWLGMKLYWIPAAQVTLSVAWIAFVVADIAHLQPHLRPRLGSWDKEVALEMLGPSLWFGSSAINSFFLYQAPVIALNHFSGPVPVVAFSICRSYYGFIRHVPSQLRISIRPELTRLSAQGEMQRLESVFERFSAFSLALAVTTSACALVGSATVVPYWTNNSSLFDPLLYALVMACTTASILRENVVELSYATNQHVAITKVSLIGFAIFAVLCPLAAFRSGPLGVAYLWLMCESCLIVSLRVISLKLHPSSSPSRFLYVLVVHGCLGVAYVLIHPFQGATIQTFRQLRPEEFCLLAGSLILSFFALGPRNLLKGLRKVTSEPN